MKMSWFCNILGNTLMDIITCTHWIIDKSIPTYCCLKIKIEIGKETLQPGGQLNDYFQTQNIFVFPQKLTFKAPITTAAYDKFWDIFPNFR